MKTVLVVAPHPDDETLGCGGTLLKRRAAGDAVHWLIVTAITKDYPAKVRAKRKKVIAQVARDYGFASTTELGLPTTGLDRLPKAELVRKISAVIQKLKPHTVFVCHPGDAHSDHGAVFDALSSAVKWFRAPFIEEILAYEALSETGFGLAGQPFAPDVFVGVEEFLDRKLEILRRFDDELGEFPFPRSPEAACALAMSRGAASGLRAAEAFQLFRERR